jgi:hypothetical protein
VKVKLLQWRDQQSKAWASTLNKTDPTWPSDRLLDMLLVKFKVISILGLQPTLSLPLRWNISYIKQLIDYTKVVYIILIQQV